MCDLGVKYTVVFFGVICCQFVFRNYVVKCIAMYVYVCLSLQHYNAHNVVCRELTVLLFIDFLHI